MKDKIEDLGAKVMELEIELACEKGKVKATKEIGTQAEEEVRIEVEVEVEGLPDPKTLKEKMVKDKGTSKVP